MSVENYIQRSSGAAQDYLQKKLAKDTLVKRLEVAGITDSTIGLYVYYFKKRGKEIVDLTDDGINYIARCAGIVIEDVSVIEENEMSFTVKASAVNQGGDRHIGIVRAERGLRDGHPTSAPIKEAVAQAQRNAKKGLLPMTYLHNLMASTGRAPADELGQDRESQVDRYWDLCREIDDLKDQVKRLERENKNLLAAWGGA